MKTWKNDVNVLFLFFARPEQTAAVFEQIKLARPRRLFLYQDGPRPGRNDDIDNIMRCRKIVDQIDWDCELYTMFQEKNFGCDPSEYISQKWMFSHVDKGIVLEDDDVPSLSFFPYCKELLDKFEHDERIGIICGMNNLGAYDNGYSYLFTRYGSIWGWATWKRNVDRWDANYDWMNDSHLLDILKLQYKECNSWFRTCRRHKATGREHYESILGAQCRLNNQLNIVPTKNMITNVGIASESTHSVDKITKLPRIVRSLFYIKRFEEVLPLKHPPYVVEDFKFNKFFEKKFVPNRLQILMRIIESRIYRMFPVLGK